MSRARLLARELETRNKQRVPLVDGPKPIVVRDPKRAELDDRRNPDRTDLREIYDECQRLRNHCLKRRLQNAPHTELAVLFDELDRLEELKLAVRERHFR